MASYKDNIPRMAEYRIEHSYRVANIGAEIALAEGFDIEKCLLPVFFTISDTRLIMIQKKIIVITAETVLKSPSVFDFTRLFS